jgi:excisionase family DNA binding protein
MSTEIPTLNKRGRAHRYSEVAKMFDVSERTIIREVRSGRLKAYRLGARIVRILLGNVHRVAAAECLRSQRQ